MKGGRAVQKGSPVVSVRNLGVSFYTNNRMTTAVSDVSLTVRSGKTLCVVGESGCGKSVTASAIMRLLPELSRIERGEIVYHAPDGDVRLDRMDPNGREIRALRGRDIAMIFQDPMTALNPVYTVGYQISENILSHQRAGRRAARARAVDLLRSMDVPLPEQRVDEYPHQFSGGMRQRGMIAIATALNPKMLIADEPTTALDVTVQAQIFQIMQNLKERHGTAILLITHDMGVVTERADDVSVMYMGYIVEEGTVDDVLRHPAHPYTRALLRSIPGVGAWQGSEPRAHPGLHARPARTAPRAAPSRPGATGRRTRAGPCPETRALSGGHSVRCWRSEEVCSPMADQGAAGGRRWWNCATSRRSFRCERACCAGPWGTSRPSTTYR
jgi:ABC-type dipeptide/oligopeptide/nickel transport system ATPase component